MRIYLGIAAASLWTSACLTSDFDHIERRTQERVYSADAGVAGGVGTDSEQPAGPAAAGSASATQAGRSAAGSGGAAAGSGSPSGQSAQGGAGQAGQASEAGTGSSQAGSSAGGASSEDDDAGASVCGDTTSDLNNCGSCGNACAAQDALASCEDSKCMRACKPGYRDCDGDLAFGSLGSGCEVNLETDVDHCSACNARCESQTGKVVSCEDSECVYTSVEIGSGKGIGELHGSDVGGSPFEEICGRNSVLVGMDIATDGNVLYGVGFICAELLLSGTNQAYVISRAENIEVLPLVGNLVSPPSAVERRLCPAGAVVTGARGVTWHYNNDPRTGLSVKQLGLPCSQLTLNSKNEIALGSGGLITGGDPGAETAELFEDACKSGQVAVGVVGRSGAYIDAIQMYCGPIALGQQTARATTSK